MSNTNNNFNEYMRNNRSEYMRNSRTSSGTAHDPDATPSKFAISPERATEIRNAPLTPFHISDAPVADASGFVDHIAPVLSAEPSLNDSQRHDLWDLAHGAKHTTELAGHLAGLNLPLAFKEDLLHAKNSQVVETHGVKPTHVDRVIDAINRVAALNPATRTLAEQHPNILKAMTSGRD